MQLTDPALHPVFLALLLDSHAPTWVTMDADKLRTYIAAMGPISSTNWNKVQAARTVRATNAPFDDFKVFTQVAKALNGGTPDFLILPLLNIPEMVGGAQMMMLLALNSDKTFSDEVMRFAAAVSDYHGAGALPEPLKRTSEYVKMPVRDAEHAKVAQEYMTSLNKLLVKQMEGVSGRG